MPTSLNPLAKSIFWRNDFRDFQAAANGAVRESGFDLPI
jgi:hypothetical protein